MYINININININFNIINNNTGSQAVTCSWAICQWSS